MMRRISPMWLALSLGALLAALAGCGRHVVLDPETVDRLNDRAWTVKSQPRPVSVIVLDAGTPP